MTTYSACFGSWSFSHSLLKFDIRTRCIAMDSIETCEIVFVVYDRIHLLRSR